MIDDTTSAYIAGLLDGEGTITLTRVHRNENRRLVVSISNNELPLLQFVKDALGVGKITRKRHYQTQHQPSFTYQVTSRQALAVLTRVTPYLRSYNRQRAEVVIKEYISVIPRNGRYTQAVSTARKRFEDRILGITAPAPLE